MHMTSHHLWNEYARLLNLVAANLHVQVDCQPSSNIVIRLLSFRPGNGGYLKLVLLNVAGTGAVQSIGLRRYQSQVSHQVVPRCLDATPREGCRLKACRSESYQSR